MHSTVMLLKHMFGKCYTLFSWRIQRGEGGKENTDDWGRPGLFVRSHNAQPPLKKWLSETRTQTPPHPLGAKRFARPLSFPHYPPQGKEGGEKYLFPDSRKMPGTVSLPFKPKNSPAFATLFPRGRCRTVRARGAHGSMFLGWLPNLYPVEWPP